MVIELTTLELVPGTDESAFRQADARVQTEFFYLQPGIVRRTTARDEDGWIVVTFWENKASALAAAEAGRSDPAATAFGALVEVLEVRRYESID